MRRRLVFVAAAACTFAAGALAQAMTVDALQRLLKTAPGGSVIAFEETRESPWLAAPVLSKGVMKSGAQGLEKSVEQPRRETWRILPDRVQHMAPGASAPSELMFSAAPGVALLAGTLRRVVAGDLESLAQDYHLQPAGDERQWTLQLTPRRPEVARVVSRVELQGEGARLRVISIDEPRGERTTTRLSHH